MNDVWFDSIENVFLVEGKGKMKLKIATVLVMAALLSGCGGGVLAAKKSDDKKMEVINKLVFGNDPPERCKGRQWKDSRESLDCQFPPPPVGRWKAVYTNEFAVAHKLPLENVSTDLSPGVDYMEMEVVRYGKDFVGTGCFVNMLIKKPHDVALYGRDGVNLIPLPQNRKLTHFQDLDKFKNNLKPIVTFQFASRDYAWEKGGYAGSTVAMYVKDILSGYDYVSANAHCREISMHPQYFPSGYAFWVNKASAWGLYEHMGKTGKHMETSSRFFINIPHELISSIFKDIAIGGM